MAQGVTDWVSAIGSVGTAVAALVALGALIVTIRLNVLARRRSDAARIRRNLSRLAQESGLLSRLLNDGSPLILGAAHIAQELQERFGREPNTRVLRKQLSDHGLLLSAAIAGWERSPLSGRVHEQASALRRLRVALTGELEVLRHVAEVYEGIVQDACSPMIFVRILTQTEVSLPGGRKGQPPPPWSPHRMASELQTGASTYYAVRYQAATANIDRFVQLAVRTLSQLPDGSLLALTRGSTERAECADTRFGAIRVLLDQASPRIPADAYEELVRLSATIEQELSKANARRELDSSCGHGATAVTHASLDPAS